MSNDPAANLEIMWAYLDSARDADGPGHVIVDAMMLSDWCSALARAIGEADGSALAGAHDAIALLRAEIERLTRERERLALAICGGEDAPGYANAQTVETLHSLRERAVNRRLQLGRCPRHPVLVAVARERGPQALNLGRLLVQRVRSPSHDVNLDARPPDVVEKLLSISAAHALGSILGVAHPCVK